MLLFLQYLSLLPWNIQFLQEKLQNKSWVLSDLFPLWTKGKRRIKNASEKKKMLLRFGVWVTKRTLIQADRVLLRAIRKKREMFSMLLWRTEKQSMSQNYEEIDSAKHTKPFYIVELSKNEKKKKAVVWEGKPFISGGIQMKMDYQVSRWQPSYF